MKKLKVRLPVVLEVVDAESIKHINFDEFLVILIPADRVEVVDDE